MSEISCIIVRRCLLFIEGLTFVPVELSIVFSNSLESPFCVQGHIRPCSWCLPFILHLLSCWDLLETPDFTGFFKESAFSAADHWGAGEPLHMAFPSYQTYVTFEKWYEREACGRVTVTCEANEVDAGQ